MDKVVQQKLEIFFGDFKSVKYKKGEVLLGFGKVPEGVFYLKKGVVRQAAVSEHGDDLTLNIFKAPSFFPMGWVMNDSQNNYQYEAMVSCEAYIAPKIKLVEFIKDQPDILFDLLKRIYWGLEGFIKRLEKLMSGSAYSRLATQLIILGKRFGIQDGDGLVINLDLTHSQLATQAGITRESTSRSIEKMEDLGLISYKNKKILIKDISALEIGLNTNSD